MRRQSLRSGSRVFGRLWLGLFVRCLLWLLMMLPPAAASATSADDNNNNIVNDNAYEFSL